MKGEHKEQENKLKAYYDALMKLPKNTEQNRFFLQLLNTKIAQLGHKEERSSKQKTWLRLTALVLSTVATIALGIKWDGNSILSYHQTNIGLTLSALVTLLSAVASFWDIDNYWLRIRLMLEKLKLLRYRYAFLLSQSPATPPSDAEMNMLMEEFRNVISDGYWEKLNTKYLLPKGIDKLSEEQMTVLINALKQVHKDENK